MATVLKIVKKSNAYTGMRIFRAEDKAQVYATAPIADLAIADSFADDTAVSGKVYFYGVELYHATDKTRYPIINAANLVDYGPYTSVVATNVEKFGSPCLFGDARLGIIQRATLAQYAGQPSPVNTGDKMADIFLAATGVATKTKVTADSPMAAVLTEGKLVVIPTAMNFYLRNEYATTNAISDVTKVSDYLKNNPAQALVDIAGYRWKIKIATKEFMVKNSPLYHSSIRANSYRPVPLTSPLDYAYAPVLFTISEVDNSVATPSADTNGFDLKFAFNANAGTNEGRTIYMYFEYVGPTPA